LNEKSKNERHILIFDLDVSLLDIDGVMFEARATAGDTHLGDDYVQIESRRISRVIFGNHRKR
jgi:L1 cell adhesion molecule like protein